MHLSTPRTSARILYTASLIALASVATPGLAQSAPATVSIPSMPLAQALKQIQSQSGTPVHFDPDAVVGMTSTAVHQANSALAAVRAALDGRRLAISVKPDGSIEVTNDIVVIAHRDEAETSVLVRQTSTSDRSGRSLREQPRNTQVISGKLIADQQNLTVLDALKNAGGVTINSANVQGGSSYSVRGFTSNGLTNGLPTTTGLSVPVGTSEPVSAIERIEVLKGPDAILAGADNLGGTVNIVYKKPSADPLLAMQIDTGSYGLRRITIDANNAITADEHLSARFIASASDADRNFGGYHGNEDYLIMPELRFKNATTDVVVGVAASQTISGLSPFTLINPATQVPYDFAINQPLFSPDQYVKVGNTQFFVNAEQKVTNWLDLVGRFQHIHSTLELNIYTLFVVLDPGGLGLLDNAQSYQTGNTDAVDVFARINFNTFGIQHKFVAGYNHISSDTTSYYASAEDVFPYQFIGNPTPATALAPSDTFNYSVGARQNGYYLQDVIQFGKAHLSGALRYTDYYSFGNGTADRQRATTPSLGAVFDITNNISLFGNYVRGFAPTFTRDFAGKQLPNIISKNIEGGVKLGLFGDRLVVNASYFDLQQSNITVRDPLHPGFSISGPGKEGKGIDLNASGTILPGWTVQASFTHTISTLLVQAATGNVVQASPENQYSVYTAYERGIADGMTAGLSAGFYGRSRAAVDTDGVYYVPASNQLDVNAMLKWHGFNFNVGVRNLFDRQNYGLSFTNSYIPYSEPRNWRLTVGYSFR